MEHLGRPNIFARDAIAASVALAVSASGSVANKTTVLLTLDEVDEVAKIHPSYRPPGQ